MFSLKVGQNIILHSQDEEQSLLPYPQSRQAGLEINLNEEETHAKDGSAYKEAQQ